MNLLKNILLIAISGIIMSSCKPKEIKQELNTAEPEYLKISVMMDTSDYVTSVIPSNNVEASDVLVVQYRLKITNITKDPATGDSVVVDKIEIIENPYKDEAPYSVDFEGNLNGLYSDNGEPVIFPLNMVPYNPLSCILKHGQTLDKTTLEFIKVRFASISKINSKELFAALIEKGMNLQNDKSLLGEEFQVIFYTKKGTTFPRDIFFPYNNYCIK